MEKKIVNNMETGVVGDFDGLPNPPTEARYGDSQIRV